jgi:DNA invertase Pin-like site-specific DNA recombinase
LPKDLAGALERLADAEVDSLLVAITAEAKRRGRPMPVSQRRPSAPDTRSPPLRAAAGGAASLTTGKLNAVRAAFKAGVRPAAIARQFGISQAEVKRALASEEQKARR